MTSPDHVVSLEEQIDDRATTDAQIHAFGPLEGMQPGTGFRQRRRLWIASRQDDQR